jgi:formylglycine-generating enzyme required for sulfatase activity
MLSSDRSIRHDELIALPGGVFTMGADNDDPDERPTHPVRLRPFRIGAYAVSNALFAHFVDDTGHVTEAEEHGWSFVFAGFLSENRPSPMAAVSAPWWRQVFGADWCHPEGPLSDLTDRGDHPVVHVSWFDAVAYCRWSGTRLPTEAEWEYAARGGLTGHRYPWVGDREPDGEHRMNIWQGRFPRWDAAEDGYSGTAPVHAYRPNGFGLHNVTGNVWEWCANWYGPTAYRSDAIENPQGPDHGEQRVIRGGSYLCHESYCARYRVSARASDNPTRTAGNIGFRCAADH